VYVSSQRLFFAFLAAPAPPARAAVCRAGARCLFARAVFFVAVV
jgi:hypothetical protein